MIESADQPTIREGVHAMRAAITSRASLPEIRVG
jgi:hypothetical protein